MTQLNWERLKAHEAAQDSLREERERAREVVTGRAWYCGQCHKRLRRDLGAALICRACRSKVAGKS